VDSSCTLWRSPYVPSLELVQNMTDTALKALTISKIHYDVSDRIYNLSFDFTKKKVVELEVDPNESINLDDPFVTSSKPIRSPP
jgi:hypothetical protein